MTSEKEDKCLYIMDPRNLISKQYPLAQFITLAFLDFTYISSPLATQLPQAVGAAYLFDCYT